MNGDPEINPESLRKALKGASLRLDEIKAKLCKNESRLIALEDGRQDSRILWDDARKSADKTLALVTAVEVGIRTFEMNGLGGTSIEQPLMAMPGFTGEEL